MNNCYVESFDRVEGVGKMVEVFIFGQFVSDPKLKFFEFFGNWLEPATKLYRMEFMVH